MLEVLAVDELFASQVQCLFRDSLKFFISLNNLPKAAFEVLVKILCSFVLRCAHGVYHFDDAHESIRPVPLHIGHQIFDFVVFGLVDNEFVAVFEEVVELVGECAMGEQGMAHLDVAVVLVLCFLILPQELGDVLVRLLVLLLQLLQPSLRLLHIYLFHENKFDVKIIKIKSDINTPNRCLSCTFSLIIHRENLSHILLQKMMEPNPFASKLSPILQIYHQSRLASESLHAKLLRKRSTSFLDFRTNRITSAINKKQVISRDICDSKLREVEREIEYDRIYGYGCLELQAKSDNRTSKLSSEFVSIRDSIQIAQLRFKEGQYQENMESSRKSNSRGILKAPTLLSIELQSINPSDEQIASNVPSKIKKQCSIYDNIRQTDGSQQESQTVFRARCPLSRITEYWQAESSRTNLKSRPQLSRGLEVEQR